MRTLKNIWEKFKNFLVRTLNLINEIYGWILRWLGWIIMWFVAFFGCYFIAANICQMPYNKFSLKTIGVLLVLWLICFIALINDLKADNFWRRLIAVVPVFGFVVGAFIFVYYVVFALYTRNFFAFYEVFEKLVQLQNIRYK